MVFVLDINKKPLSPCHHAKARRLLKTNKASIFRRFPFTIILKKEKIQQSNQGVRLKIDYGSRYTGLAILNNNNVLWLGQIQHKINIKKDIDVRRQYRKHRRKKLRYRKPRYLNRKRSKGWIPPSLESRVGNIKNWINKLRKLTIITHISYENCKFDTQLMKNPEITGIEYQQGILRGYEVREYLLEKYNRTCCYCGKQNTPLEIEHIIPKSRGGTNRVSNLCIACHHCNQTKGAKTANEFGFPNIQNQVGKTLKNVAIINSTRWKIYEILIKTGLQVECGSGARTKMNRIKLILPKSHYFDACCIGKSTPNKLYFKTNKVLYIQAKGRGVHRRTNVNKYGFPRGYFTRQKFHFGFQTGDMAKAVIPTGKYKGIHYGRVNIRRTGRFNMSRNNKCIIPGVSYKYFKIIQKFDGYSYSIS